MNELPQHYKQILNSGRCARLRRRPGGLRPRARLQGRLLRRAWSNFKRAGARSRYERFFADNRHWLEGYSFFAAIKGCRGGQPWYEWPEDLKFRRHEALHRTWMEMADEIEFHH